MSSVKHMKLGMDRVNSLFMSNHNLLTQLHQPPSFLPNKPDHLKRHPLCLDLWIAQDRLADATKAKDLETCFSHCTCHAWPLLVGPSDFLLSILRYPHLIYSYSTDMLASLVTFVPTVPVVFPFYYLRTLCRPVSPLLTRHAVCRRRD